MNCMECGGGLIYKKKYLNCSGKHLYRCPKCESEWIVEVNSIFGQIKKVLPVRNKAVKTQD